MTREFIKKQIAELKTVYGSKFTINQNQFDVWCKYFQDCKEKSFEEAVEAYIKNNEFPPVIAGIMKYYTEIEEYKSEMKRFLFGYYSTMRAVWDEPYDLDTMNEYIRTVCKNPKSIRKEIAIDIANKAIRYHHDCEYEGLQAVKLIQFLKEVNYEC